MEAAGAKNKAILILEANYSNAWRGWDWDIRVILRKNQNVPPTSMFSLLCLKVVPFKKNKKRGWLSADQFHTCANQALIENHRERGTEEGQHDQQPGVNSVIENIFFVLHFFLSQPPFCCCLFAEPSLHLGPAPWTRLKDAWRLLDRGK